MATDADWETVKEDDHDNKSTDSIESYSMGEIIDKIGFTKFHIPLILLTSVGFLASNIQLILMSVLQPILRKYFSREKHIELYTALMISAQFLGAIIGGSLGGIWADRYGRLSIFHGSTAIAATFSIIFTLLNFPIMMIGCRFMIGFAIGAGSLSDFSLLAEFLPSKLRGKRMVCVVFFGTLSYVYVAVSGWSTNPNVNWRVFNVFCAAPYFILFPLRIIFWRHESPYIVQKRSYAKALILLHKMDVDKKISKFSLASQDTVQHRTNLAWKLTICASVIFFLQSFAYYGLTFTLQALAKDLEIKNLDIFINFIGIATSQIPGLIFSSLIIDRLGRRPLLCIGLLGSAVSSASLIAIAKDRTLFTTATSVVYMFIVMSWTSIYIGFPELFPASSRARSFSIASVFGKVAGLLAPHFFHSSLGAHATLGSVIASFAVSSLIVISMMPETADKLLS